MKVFQINSVCGIRSTGRICTDIADILKEQGHECRIAYGRETVPEKYRDTAVRIGSDFGVKINALKARLLDNEGFNAKQATEKLVALMKDYNPDVIHLHNVHGYYLNLPELFTYLASANKPVVWTLHDCWAFTGHCSYFDFIGCDKWRTGCVRCPQKKAYPASYLADCSMSNWKKKKDLFTSVQNMTLVTPSEWLAGLVKQSFLGKYPVKVIRNGVDTTVFKPTYGNFRNANHLENQKIVLGVASVWDKRKGLDDFIKLSEMLDSTYSVVLVGISEKQKRRLPEGIIGITRTNNTTQLAEIYTAADVFVNPTYEDNYPTVNLEAQACGTPVITYNTGGSPESVNADAVVAKGNLNGILARIKTCNTLGVRTLPEKKEQYKKYIGCYEELING